jgi:hypothetical protein
MVIYIVVCLVIALAGLYLVVFMLPKPPETSPLYPPCANWSVWVGAEVEGTEDVGVSTLFVRDFKGHKLSWVLSEARKKAEVDRIWFCKEFQDWGVVRLAHDLGYKVCLEATFENPPPKDICLFTVVYWKQWIAPEFKYGDFVCLGNPFNDEAFMLGKGQRVTPGDYTRDEQIL